MLEVRKETINLSTSVDEPWNGAEFLIKVNTVNVKKG